MSGHLVHQALTATANLLAKVGGTGVDRPLFPLGSMDYAGISLAAFFVMIAAGGGIGGGGVLVPTYIFILGFKPHIAIPLSNATILGSSIANCLLNAKKRHPTANRPLIDWDIMLVMEPLTIAGAVVGSVLNVLCPSWLLCTMLVLLLGATTIKTGLKGIKMFRKESQAKEAEKTAISSNSAGGHYTRLADSTTMTVKGHCYTPDLPKSEELESLLAVESKHSVPKMMAMLFCTVGTLALTILKGGEGINPMDITCGTPVYWFLTFAVVPFTLIIGFFARRHLVARYHLKDRLGFEYAEGDVEWNERNTLVYPGCCSIAGLCAGLFGIGGGIVKGPLMLEMGTRPEVASATSATMILFTSSAATASYLLFNSLNMDYALVLFPLGFICTLIGQIVLNAIVKYYQRSSFVILVITIVIALSTIAMGFESSGSILDLIHGVAEPVKHFCE